MSCFMCFSPDDTLQMFKSDMDIETVERIMTVLPDFLIPKSKEPVFICSSCLKQISFFYTIKKASLQNCSRLKHFNAMLKKTNNVKCDELDVILKSDELSAQPKHQFNVNPKSNYLLSSDNEDATHIKEEDKEYNNYSQLLVNHEASLNNLQGDDSSCSSKNSIQYHNVGPFEFVDTNKFTEENFTVTSNNSRCKDQPKTQLESQRKRFKCIECHKTFAQRNELENHIRVHTGEKPYKCTTCEKTFAQLAHLNTHKHTHTNEKSHECDVCHKTFFQKRYLIYHKRQHDNVRPFQCSVCNRGFLKSNDLTRHMFTHTGEKPHQCHLCEYKCIQSGYLKTHILTHTGEKPHSCKHCEKSFTSKGHLKRHESKHHGGSLLQDEKDSNLTSNNSRHENQSETRHECDVCNIIFNEKNDLINHKRGHDNERPHKCAVCNNGFLKSSDLTRHMFTHTGEKPHQCHLCEYKTTQSGALKIHIRSHTGEKPFSCKHCEQSFTSTSHLKKHARRHQSNDNID